jgi:hypothetical protein
VDEAGTAAEGTAKPAAAPVVSKPDPENGSERLSP